MAETLNKDFARDTIVQGYWLPAIRAAIELNAKNAVGAVELLKTAAPYELGQCEPFQVGMLYPIYLRGQAHLLAHHGKEAAAEFQKMFDHRGILLNFPAGCTGSSWSRPLLPLAGRRRQSPHRLPGFPHPLEGR